MVSFYTLILWIYEKRSNFLFSLKPSHTKRLLPLACYRAVYINLRREKPGPDLQADRAGFSAQLRLPEHCSYCRCDPHVSPAADWNELAHLEFTTEATPHRAAVKEVFGVNGQPWIRSLHLLIQPVQHPCDSRPPPTPPSHKGGVVC